MVGRSSDELVRCRLHCVPNINPMTTFYLRLYIVICALQRTGETKGSLGYRNYGVLPDG